MSSFNANSQMYNVVTENELAEVLSHYSSEFIYSIVDNAMKARFNNVPIATIPNVVAAWEQNFKAIIETYGSDSAAEVFNVRNETYREIIDCICKEFGLNFTIDDSIDLYSASYHLYDLFVCNFMNSLTTFFANFIYKERTMLYDSLGLVDFKKNKDTSTIYGKKNYKDIKIAIINANIDFVISEICKMEIPFHLIINHVCNNNEVKKFIISIVSSDDEFFTRVYGTILNTDIRSDIITSIRFKLQEIAMAHDQIVSIDMIANNNAEDYTEEQKPVENTEEKTGE